MKKLVILIASHVLVFVLGFAGGIYILPILIAPESPTATQVANLGGQAEYRAKFRRDLKGSDMLHWGEGNVAIGRSSISFMGKLAPGPDYKLYLSPEYVETEEEFSRVKSRMLRVGDVKTFENFIVPFSATVDVSQYTTVIVWCEAFGEFISAARYR